jgi:hypothetical protein
MDKRQHTEPAAAPERPGADWITREVYSHEVISCGFWPGTPRGLVREAAADLAGWNCESLER